MPHPLDLPREDTRKPRFGCGRSFGMLGPTRLVLQFSTLPPGWVREGTLCLPHTSDFFLPDFTHSMWSTVYANGDDAHFTLTSLSPVLGTWLLQSQVWQAATSTQYVASREVVNFQWGFAPHYLDDQVIGPSTSYVFRVGEWQTVSERFSAVAFPDV